MDGNPHSPDLSQTDTSMRGATGLAVLLLLATQAGASIFNFLPRPELFPACLKTVSTTLVRIPPGTAITTEDAEPICEEIIIAAPHGPAKRTTEVLADCAELAGRMEEAAKNGYLNDGTEFCGNVLKQSATDVGAPLGEYVPTGETTRRKFCGHFRDADIFTDLCVAHAGVHKAKEESISPASESPGPESPAARLMHDAADFSGPEPRKFRAAADTQPAAGKFQLAAQDATATSTATATATATDMGADAGKQVKTRLTSEYMKQKFGDILRWGEGPVKA